LILESKLAVADSFYLFNRSFLKVMAIPLVSRKINQCLNRNGVSVDANISVNAPFKLKNLGKDPIADLILKNIIEYD